MGINLNILPNQKFRGFRLTTPIIENFKKKQVGRTFVIVTKLQFTNFTFIYRKDILNANKVLSSWNF